MPADLSGMALSQAGCITSGWQRWAQPEEVHGLILRSKEQLSHHFPSSQEASTQKWVGVFYWARPLAYCQCCITRMATL